MIQFLLFNHRRGASPFSAPRALQRGVGPTKGNGKDSKEIEA